MNLMKLSVFLSKKTTYVYIYIVYTRWGSPRYTLVFTPNENVSVIQPHSPPDSKHVLPVRSVHTWVMVTGHWDWGSRLAQVQEKHAEMSSKSMYCLDTWYLILHLDISWPGLEIYITRDARPTGVFFRSQWSSLRIPKGWPLMTIPQLLEISNSPVDWPMGQISCAIFGEGEEKTSTVKVVHFHFSKVGWKYVSSPHVYLWNHTLKPWLDQSE